MCFVSHTDPLLVCHVFFYLRGCVTTTQTEELMTDKQGVKSGTENTNVCIWMYGCALFLLPVCIQ